MKNLLFILSIVFFAVGCGGNEPDFESHSDASPSIATSRGGEGGVSTRRVQVDITVGVETSRRGTGGKGSARHPGGKPSGPSGGGTDPNLCPQPCLSQGTDPKGSEGMASSDPKVDILFFLGHKNHGKCYGRLASSIKETGFAGRIGDLDWQMSTAFSHQSGLYTFRSAYRGGTGSLLSVGGGFFKGNVIGGVLKRGVIKNNKEVDKTLAQTIVTEYYRYVADDHDPEGTNADPPGTAVFPMSSEPSANPLGNLDWLLKENPNGFIRKKEGSQVFIVLVDFNYFYKSRHWEIFMEGRENVNLIFVSSHTQSAGPLNVREMGEEFGSEWIGCSSSELAGVLANRISGQSGMAD